MRVRPIRGYSEDLRQLEHLAPISFAFLIRYLTWHQALLFASLAVLYGFLSPRLWPATRRPAEAEKRFSGGKVAYAVAVFLLVLFFPDRKFIVVAVWANLSVGDAVSNIVGRNFGRSLLPWNSRKTWTGTMAAFLASTAMAWVLMIWTGVPNVAAPAALAFGYALGVSAVCSLVESLPLPVDDNLTLCAAGALFLAWLSAASLPTAFDSSRLMIALGVSCFSGAVALVRGAVSAGGFLSGTVIGTVVFYAFGASGFVVLALFFVLGTVFTRVGYASKRRMGTAQPHGSRRLAAHVWGKGVAAFLAAVCSLFLQDTSPAALAFVAAVAASLYDTTATELGLLTGGRTYLLHDLRRVPAGTRGAVSLAGSTFGLAGACLVAGTAYCLGLVHEWGVVWSLLSAMAAAHLESWAAGRPMGAWASGPMMNAFHTASAMLLATVLARGGK